MRTLFSAALASLLSLSLFVGPVSAATNQATTVAQAARSGSISGQVTADGGAGIAGATVLFDGAGQHQSVTTDGSGNFTASLPPGLYSVTVNKAGYQTGTTQVPIGSGESVSVNVALTAASLENLNVIGRTSSSGNGNGARFNVSSTPTQTLTQQQILIRNTPDLTQIVNELPGVTIPHASSNPNQSFIVRGLRFESRTEIDGHPVSSGTGGTFLTNYTAAPIFGQIDLEKGTGLSGPLAGSSGAGVVNLRTPDFTYKDSAFVQGGVDSYGGSFYTALVDFNIGKFSFILGRTFSGYRGPTFDTREPDGSGFTIPPIGQYQAPILTNALIPYIQDFSNSYNLNAELAKMRYQFSGSTSFQAEFLGLQGSFNPQGGAYGQFAGYGTIPLCRNGTAAGNGAACTDLSTYNSPAAVGAGLVGQSGVPLYVFFPGSFVEQNQPNFNAEFKTTLGNDTILLRPYTAAINRLIDGTRENAIPGDAAAWNQVTNVANCQPNFTAPSAANGGAQGPCYAAGVNPVAGYIGTSTLPVVFATTPVAPTCTVAVPCYTSSTAINNSGQYGFGSPFTTLEVDHLAGYTFSYIHPVGANTFSASFDHYFDDATDFTNDASPLAAGCTFVLGSGQTNAAPFTAPGSQPTCPLPSLRPSPIAVPETFSSVTSISGTAQIQVLPKLEADIGLYFTNYQMLGQQQNPAITAALLPTYGPAGRTGAIPVVLGPLTNSAAHFDPHFGLVYRANKDWVVRFTAGSSMQIPYASLVSGFTTYSQGATSTTVSSPNPLLAPEELVNLDLGSDWRTPDGTVLSGDIYNIVIHNPWLSTKQIVCFCTLPGLEPVPETFSSITVNGAQQYAQGIEFSITNEPAVGFGYRVNTSFERNYYLGTNPALFGGSPQTFFNGNQFVSTGSGSTSVPYSKAYAEVQYALPNKGLFRIGADYEGPNNSYNAPAFFIFDAGGRINTGFHDIMFGADVENLTSVNFGALLSRGVEFQGLAPEAATPTVGGYTYTSQQFNTALTPPPPMTIRVYVQKNF